MKFPRELVPILLLPLLLTACIGTDIIDDPVVPPRVAISPRIDSLSAGETVQFAAKYYNDIGIAEEQAITWISTDTGHIQIDENGLATGIVTGPAQLIATGGGAADTLTLNTAGVTNVTTLRAGDFEGRGGYSASGEARLERQTDGSLKLFFGSDFSASAGPSIYILLANHTSGNYSVTAGSPEVNSTSAQISSTRVTNFSGAMEFDVPADVDIDDFDFVVLYCVIGPVFGFAELN